MKRKMGWLCAALWMLCMALAMASACAQTCAICDGDTVCDTCGGEGYQWLQAYGTQGMVQVYCTGGCVGGACPDCHIPCPFCNSDGICDTCMGNGYLTMKLYGSDEAVKVACSGSYCRNGLCGACRNVDIVVSEVCGFGNFRLLFRVNDEKVITQAVAIEHNETPGFGADLLDGGALNTLIGQPIETAEIDIKAGVTFTSTAIMNAVEQAAGAAGVVYAPQELEAPAYQVEGFAPFAVHIDVDNDGTILSARVQEHNETPGFGADMLTRTNLKQLVGQYIGTAKIDAKAGVTLTSNAINDALRQAAAAEGFLTDDKTVYSVTGFQPFKVEIAVDADGKISYAAVPEHNETPGFGADLIASGVLNALIGQPVASAQIDAKAGVTLTSNAINDALRQAAAANKKPYTMDDLRRMIMASQRPYSVTGFQPFNVEIAVDADGTIISVHVPKNNETPGFGADLIASGVLDTVVGQPVTSAQIDAKAGVTLTSNAINDALSQAAEEYMNR